MISCDSGRSGRDGPPHHCEDGPEGEGQERQGRPGDAGRQCDRAEREQPTRNPVSHRRRQSLDANGTDTALSAAAAAVSREASGIGAGDAQTGANFGPNQGRVVTEKGPDGVNRKVRIVGPTP